MDRPRDLPNPDRVSVLAATSLLAYALTRFIEIPGRELAIQLPGLYLTAQLNFRTFVALLVAGMTASGATWLMRDHPDLQKGGVQQHWILPALVAWAIGIPLYQLPYGVLWWIGLAIGGVLLILVLVAEYVVVDPEDVRYPLAAAVLTALSFALFLMLATTLRSAGVRLYVILPALTLAGGLVGLRSLRLRLHGEWHLFQAGIIALIIGQLTAALHYWPLAPMTFGLLVLAPAYALTSLIGGLAEGRPLRQALVEPGLALLLVAGVAWWTR